MSTENDLRRLGQAAAALAGVAAARAKQVAEQLLNTRAKPREDAKTRAGNFVEEGRHAAADVVSALRREASVILRDLETLEQTLRSGEGGDAGEPTTASEPAPRATKDAPAKRSPEKSAATPRKTTTAKKAAATGTAKKASPQTKAAGGRKAAAPRKSAGGPGRSPNEEQG